MKEMMLLFALMLFSGCAEKQETVLEQNPAEITTQTTIQMEEADRNDGLSQVPCSLKRIANSFPLSHP
jgi:PBP1b-binding outer membrane lipoprotein LpoB